VTLGFNNKRSNKSVAKMQHLSTETNNNESVSRVLFRISAETCLKMDYFASKFTKSPTA